MWLDDVFIPWERVFLVEPSPEPIATWLLWHHLYGWLAKAEFTLGLALALADAMAPEGAPADRRIPRRSGRRGADRARPASPPPSATRLSPSAAIATPTTPHLLPGGLSILKARQRISEILRIVPGLVAGRGAVRQRPRRPANGGGARGKLRRRRLHREAARRIAAAGGRPCLLGPRRPRIAPSSCMPAAASRRGAAGCGSASRATTNWPTRCCARSTFRCRRSMSACIPAAPLAPRRPNIGAAVCRQAGGIAMRTGAEYREALRDGRRVWVMGGGWIDDVTTHPATRAMVEEYVAWYDRHLDPEWRETLLAPAERRASARPGLSSLPRTKRRSARYGPVLRQDPVPQRRQRHPRPRLRQSDRARHPDHGAGADRPASSRLDNALAYRDMIARTGRFITYCGGAPIVGQRMRPDPRRPRRAEAGARDRCRRRDPRPARHAYEPGLCRGRLCRRHVGRRYRRPARRVHRAGRGAGRHDPVPQDRRRATPNPFVVAACRAASTSSTARCGSTMCSCRGSTCSLSAPSPTRSRAGCAGTTSTAGLPKAEFTLGLALALADAMGLKEHEQTVEYLVDLVVEVQTVRSCIAAAERDPEFTPAGYCFPNHRHLAAGGIALVQGAAADLGDPAHRARLLSGRGAGRQRSRRARIGGRPRRRRSAAAATPRCSARRCCSWPGITSPRRSTAAKSAFELHASGGMPNWRGWLRQNFRDYNELANAVLRSIDMTMPEIDVGAIPNAPITRRRFAAGVPPAAKS